ncbi:MAG TPA: ferritin [Anaerolineae bacterium]|nr:ferritin [Anaerolineae bacterium]
MLISKKLNDAMNAQIGDELMASNQYLNIAAYFDSETLPELAAFFFRQSDEERMHALKFVRYILDAGGTVAVPAMEAPTTEIGSAEAAAQMALDWEIEVTNKINALMDIAVEEKDYIAQEFLHWFVNEQLEEVSSMDGLLSVIRRAGEKQLLMVENYVSRQAAAAPEEDEEA